MTIQKRDMGFGARIPPSSTWGYQTILDFYPETWGKWSKISRAYFSDWLEPLLLCSVWVNYAFKDWNPTNQRLFSSRSFQVSFWIIYIWWEWLERVGWDVLNRNNMELLNFGDASQNGSSWCLSNFLGVINSSTQLVRWGAPPSCKCDTTPVNPANHTRGMNPSTYPTGFRAPFLYQAWSCFLMIFLHILPMGSFSPREKSPFVWVNVHFTWFCQASNRVPSLRMDTTVWN